MIDAHDTFPRQQARTRRFTLGAPRDLTITPDGARAVFLRSRGGDDPVNCLWVIDLGSGVERLVADPISLLAEIAADDADLPAEERARRERMRESGEGVTSYALDGDGRVASFALAGQLFVAGLVSARARHVAVAGPVFDPRPDPGAQRVAYVSGRTLRIGELDGSSRLLADEPDAETVSWGSADFVAAEEMRRFRGFWWSPTGDALAVCRVDDADVDVWYIADPAMPSRPPTAVRYPTAGTANPDVTLHLCPLDGATAIPVEWDHTRLPYLAQVHWNEHGLIVIVQSRDQRDLEIRRVDITTGRTELLWADHDAAWVELVPGSGQLIDADRLVVCADREGARRLLIGGEPVSPPDVQVRGVISATTDDVLVTANPIDDASILDVWRWTPDAFAPITDGGGVHGAVSGGGTTIIRSSTLDAGGRWMLPGGQTLADHAEDPIVVPTVQIGQTAERALATAVLLPTDHDGSKLPVLLDPYGGPHAQRVVCSRDAFLTSQWFADQGFAVVVTDGRGTPGRGSEFERAVHLDLADGVLDDQIEGLLDAADRHPELDLERVAIRGWSFGGFLAALAVLRRPDVVHAAVAGAPVTEWRLYDTHYTERYLGDPATAPDVYDANSLIPLAGRLTRPLLLIHGLADDNVVAAHTLQFSSALLAAGRPHEVLPLVGVTHMTPQEEVAENLLLHQLEFVRRSLGVSTVRGGTTNGTAV